MLTDDEEKELRAENARLKNELEVERLLRKTMNEMTSAHNSTLVAFYQELKRFVRPQGVFKQTIWFMWKPGEERTYAMTKPPSDEWAALQVKAGFHIVSFMIDVPDPALYNMGTVASVEVPVSEAAPVNEDPREPAPAPGC